MLTTICQLYVQTIFYLQNVKFLEFIVVEHFEDCEMLVL